MEDEDDAEVIEVGYLVMLTTGDGPVMVVTDAWTDDDGVGYCDAVYGLGDTLATVVAIPADCLDVLEHDELCPECGADLSEDE